jgi:hypothetical protein
MNPPRSFRVKHFCSNAGASGYSRPAYEMRKQAFTSIVIFRKKTMTKSAKTVFLFGIYLALVGVTLLLIPNTFLSVFGMAGTSEVWIRLAGILLMALSVYYVVAAKHELPVIFKVTACIRCTIIFFFAAFVYLDMMDPVMLGFGAFDFAGGAWTYFSMKKEGLW